MGQIRPKDILAGTRGDEVFSTPGQILITGEDGRALWGDGGNGPAGDDGAPGSVWYQGAAAPGVGLGIDGDYYLRTSNSDVYTKDSGAWSVIGNIRGAQGDAGAPGDDGAPGAAGANGATWRSGDGAPSNALGVDGDFYLDQVTGDVYKRTGGNYAVVANIAGPQGEKGDPGDTGPAGPSPTGSGNKVLATPANGTEAEAALRSLVSDDVPNLAIGKISDLQTVLDGKQPIMAWYPGGVPIGAIDNANTHFDLPHEPVEGSLPVFKNGRIVASTDYSVDGSGFDFAVAPVDADGEADEIYVGPFPYFL